MRLSRLDLLKRIYTEESERGGVCEIDLKQEKFPKDLIHDATWLETEGYIRQPLKATWKLFLELTQKGSDYIEDGYQNKGQEMNITGNNNIIVNGSNNQIKDNYNQIEMEIQQSDLPEDIKAELNSFMEDMKMLKDDSEKSRFRIKDFLAAIGAGTAANIAAPGLVFLIQALCQRL